MRTIREALALFLPTKNSRLSCLLAPWERHTHTHTHNSLPSSTTGVPLPTRKKATLRSCLASYFTPSGGALPAQPPWHPGRVRLLGGVGYLSSSRDLPSSSHLRGGPSPQPRPIRGNQRRCWPQQEPPPPLIRQLVHRLNRFRVGKQRQTGDPHQPPEARLEDNHLPGEPPSQNNAMRGGGGGKKKLLCCMQINNPGAFMENKNVWG